jgi:uncharacterized protein
MVEIPADSGRGYGAEMLIASFCFNADTNISYHGKKARTVRNDARAATGSACWRTAKAELSLGLTRNEFYRVAAERFSAGTEQTNAYPGPWTTARNALAVFKEGMRRCVMPILRCAALAFAAAFSGFCVTTMTLPAQAQTAIDAAQELADMLDNATFDLSSDNVVSALQGAADAGQPIALWQLGLMYESGVGVEKDQARAFQYFSQIANEHADAPPRSLDADIVAQSFVKMSDYYMHGMPDAGVAEDNSRAHTLILHAAAYFGDADAQYRAGVLYLDPRELGPNPLQSARWFSLAARKGHPGAQAKLGELLVVGNGIEPQPVEGLMWLTLAQRRSAGTSDEAWIRDLSESVMHNAPAAQVEAAEQAANTLGSQFANY